MGHGPHLKGKMEGEKKILSYEEVMQILSEQASKGSISAATALERALRQDRDRKQDEVGSALGRILTKANGSS